MYYRGAAAAIVVYDITRSSSFKTLKHWVEELKTKGPKDIAIAIAGNKADLDHMRVRRFVASLHEFLPWWFHPSGVENETDQQNLLLMRICSDCKQAAITDTRCRYRVC
jgi:GTPase SAR1 family protein